MKYNQIAFRSTSQPAAAAVRIKLDHIPVDHEMQNCQKDDIIDQRDAEYKQEMKQRMSKEIDERRTTTSRLLINQRRSGGIHNMNQCYTLSTTSRVLK